MQLWYYVSQPNGEQAFVEWFCKLFAHNMTGEVRDHTIFFNRDAAKTLHTLLNMSKAYGLDIQSFFDLLQRVAEEQVRHVAVQCYSESNSHIQSTGDSIMSMTYLIICTQKQMQLDDEQLDDLVPLAVLRRFATDFVGGFISFMQALGFAPDAEL